MNIAASLPRYVLILCVVLTATVGLAARGACGDECPYDPNRPSIDQLEKVIRAGIEQSVRVVEPVYDDKVRSYLRTYLERQPQYTEELIARAEVYFPIFERYLQAYGLPTDLKYLAIVESGLRANATSPVGAAGLWQFMRGTGQMFDLQITAYVDERRDPEKSTEAAVRYLKQLYDEFGSWELAMAGYNAGPGRVYYAMRKSGQRNYWKLKHYLPRETRSYVPGFIAANYLFNHYDKHGLDPRPLPEEYMRTSTIKVYEGMSFHDINRVTGVSMRTLSFLNPKYSKRYIPNSVVGFELVLPVFAMPMLVEHLGIPAEELSRYVSEDVPLTPVSEVRWETRTAFVNYRVRKGDNLYTLASNNACTVKDLMRWNNLSSSDLRINQRLKIKVTERVAVYPSVDRKVAAVEPLPSMISPHFVPTFDKPECEMLYDHPVLDFAAPPSRAVRLHKRMSVRMAADRLGDSTEINYAAAAPGYVVTTIQ